MFPAVCLVDSSIQVSGVLGDRELPFVVGLSSLGLNDQRHQAEARSRDKSSLLCQSLKRTSVQLGARGSPSLDRWPLSCEESVVRNKGNPAGH